ncbi:MAG: 3-hydroxyacyl-CoA dehydrogenase NAD-binding domain-containing protein [bacterium]
MSEPIETINISIIGAGTMGRGIAIALGEYGFKPVLIEPVGNEDLLAAKDSKIVIEAVIEEFEAKRAIFQRLNKLCSADTIFASNTSSLGISELSKIVDHPENFIGLHFFNPADKVDFVEIVSGIQTADATIKQIQTLVSAINKKSVIIKDTPGFIVNRLLFIMINEAAFFLQSGSASAKDINMAMKLGTNSPMGPLAIADLIGIDVCLSILESLNKRIPNGKYEPCPVFYQMIKAGYLGRKVKKGFYNYVVSGGK